MILNSFSLPCSVIDVLSDGWTRVFINMVLDVLTIGVRINALAVMAALDCDIALQAFTPSNHV